MTDIVRSAGLVSQEDLDEQARRAVAKFKSLQPTLSAFARVLTGNPAARVEMAAQSNGMTDGQRIYMRPPIGLGRDLLHTRSLCDRRDPELQLLCEACAVNEKVMATVYHEIAHIAFGTFSDVSEEDRKRAITAAIRETGGRRAEEITERLVRAPSIDSHMALASNVNEFLPMLLNSMEDARVDSEMFKARRGTRRMFEADSWKTFNEGVEQRDGTGKVVTIPWNEYALNAQVMVGVYCKILGYDYSNWFHEGVVEALNDPQLTEMLADFDQIESVREVYMLSFAVMERLREMGFLGSPMDPLPPLPEPEPDQEGDSDPDQDPVPSDDEQDGDESDDEGESDGSEGNSDSESGESDESESESSDDSDSDGSEGEGDEPGDGDDSESDQLPGNGDGDETDEPSANSDASGDDEGDSSADEDELDGDSGDSASDEDAGPSEAASGSDQASEEQSEDGDGDGSVGEGSGEASDDDADGTGSAGAGEADSVAEAGAGEPSGHGTDDHEDPTSEGEDDNEADSVQADAGDSAERGDSEGTPAEATASDSVGEIGEGEEADDGPGDADGGPDSGTVSNEGDVPIEADGAEGEDQGPAEESPEAEELVDTGADDGYGGTRLIEQYEDRPDMGEPHEIEGLVQSWGEHEEKPKTADVAASEKAMDSAVMQGLYFTTPSRNVSGVHIHTVDKHSFSGPYDRAEGWTHAYWSGYRGSYTTAPISIEESILTKPLLEMRVAFSDNKRGHFERHRKTGKVDVRVLGRRAPLADPRLFKKKNQPGKRDYFVLLGMDISGSTFGTNLQIEKNAVMAQATLLDRMGIRFAVYAHSGDESDPSDKSWTPTVDMDIYEIKAPNDPWTSKQQNALASLGPHSVNLDGHTLEFYRKILDRETATDRVLIYYTDGKMPAENEDEELVILQREIKICRDKGYTLMGVGIRTDSPNAHGLDTVQIDHVGDTYKVVEHLKKRLAG